MKLRALVLLLTGVLLSALGSFARADAAPVEGAAPVAYPPSLCSTLSVSTTRPNLGETITVTGVNFAPNTAVALRLHSSATPSTMAATYPAVMTDPAGSFTRTVLIPASVANEGMFVLTATSGFTASGACPGDPSVVLTLGSNGTGGTGTGSGSGSGGGTAFTGLDVAALIGLAALLLGIGVAFVHRGRRRTT